MAITCKPVMGKRPTILWAINCAIAYTETEAENALTHVNVRHIKTHKFGNKTYEWTFRSLDGQKFSFVHSTPILFEGVEMPPAYQAVPEGVARANTFGSLYVQRVDLVRMNKVYYESVEYVEINSRGLHFWHYMPVWENPRHAPRYVLGAYSLPRASAGREWLSAPPRV